MTGFLVPNRPGKRKSIDEIIAESEDLPKIDEKNDPSKDIVPLKDDNNSGKEIKDSVFDIVEVNDYFRISGIMYNKQLCVYDFSKKLSDIKSQDAHAEDAKNAKSDDFIASSAPLVYSICKTLYENKDCDKNVLVENARKTLNEFFKKYYLCTLSRAVYETNGQDKVIHDYLQNTSYETSGQFVGPEGYITYSKTNADSFVHAVFDTKDSMKDINIVFEWITNLDSYVLRLNNNPFEKVELSVDLVSNNSDNVYVRANSQFYNVGHALGVRLHKILEDGDSK